MRMWGVVVARAGRGAKSRLAPVLGDDDRRSLALAMLADVLRVCSAPEAPLAGVVAVVSSLEAEAVAASYDAIVVPDGGADMNLAARTGLDSALRGGADTAIVLPGDIPLVSAADLRALAEAAADAPRAVVIGASRDGYGTNALLLRPPDVMPPAFGPPSVERHARLAREAGALTRVVPHLGLALDVDTPADLALLPDLPLGPHTSEFLARSRELNRLVRI